LDTRLDKLTLGPADVTVAADSSAGSVEITPSGSGLLGRSGGGVRCRVHLVEGSGTELSGETENLLRSRLRSAALLLFGGFAAFLVWHTMRLELTRWLFVIDYAVHIVCTLVLGAITISLHSRCPMTTRQLRAVELVTFGFPIVFFTLLQHTKYVASAATYGTLPELASLWLLTIFTYALFIPNQWKRAATVIGLMSAAPLATAIISALVDPAVGRLLATDSQTLVEMLLVMALTAGSAVIGVYTINSLRDEANRAKQLGQYKLKRLIGSGGMGDVYLAEHVLMKRPCAIKVIRPEKAGDPKVLARFEREVQATAKLSHWNSVDIFDYGRADDGTFYYVMEYLPGMNLAEIVRRYGPLPAARALHLVRQACDALQEAHDVGLIHRDIKPANIFAAVRGGLFDVAKLLDFGLAKPLSNLDGEQITQEGTITGSPLYMSPEQAVGDHEPDARSDIYGLGTVLYFLLTGRPPFEDEKPMKVLIAHAHQQPQPPSTHNSDVPDDIDLIVMRCLQKSPAERFQSATELAAAIEDCDDFGRWTPESARNWWREHESRTGRSADELANA
jgi:eukaryotic-like serine/threonine-protein kinase